MPRPTIALATILMAALLATGTKAATLPQTTSPDTTTTRIEPVRVTAGNLPWGENSLTNNDLRGRSGGNLAEKLEDLPGVAAVRRGASASELVIRGLGWERVQTILGAVPLYGACPGRMDPPATYLDALATEQVTVFRQGGATLAGPGGTGGAIVANPDYERRPGAPTGVTPWLGTGYESARDAFSLEGGLFGGTGNVDYKLGGGHRTYEDYTAPDGTLVPAGQTTSTVSGSVGWRPTDDQRLWYAGTFTRDEDVDFPALPMNIVWSDFQVHNLGYRAERACGLVRRIELTAGLSAVDHLMDNARKPSRNKLEAATGSDANSAAAHAVFDLDPGAGWQLRTGLDASRLTRDALRTRRMVATGMTFHDRLWPDAVQQSGGGFVDLTRDLSKTLTLTLNGRLDVVDSKARAADDPSLGGLSVREQYVAYYGAGAAETDRTETLGQFQLGLTGRLGDNAGQWYARTGLSTRPGGITERYYAFGPAPGGYQVGDPTLQAEKKWEGELGTTLTGDHFTLSVSAFHAAVADFILPTVIDHRDVDGDGNPDTIKGFANVDATLSGGELGLEYHPIPTVYVPMTLSYVRGQNTSNDRDLPEVPPLFGTVDARWQVLAAGDTWLRGGCNFAADQEHVDPLFPEDRTGGYTTWHLGLESEPLRGWRLGLLVDNLFDKLYNEHLTREAVLPVGDLAAGQEVPAPGRNVTVTLRVEF